MEKAPRRALLLDYDGTLAPLIVDRDHAYPYQHIAELLDEISSTCGTHVAIITGREANDIPFLLRTKHRLEVWGCHGLERVRADGTYWRATFDPEIELSLQIAVERLRGYGLAGRVETKPGCVAVHWRGLTELYSDEVKSAALDCFSRLSGMYGLYVEEFDQGVELRISGGRKGKVVETILSEIGNDSAVAYLGDDTTDEDAFRALNGRGLTILVRPEHRSTAAQFWLRPPDDVIWFLRTWLSTCTGAK